MKKETSITICAILVLWQVLSMVIGKEILLPSPWSVCGSIVQILSNSESYQMIGFTLMRTARGFLISFCFAFVIAVLSKIFPVFGDFFEPIFLITKSIPNASYMILALIWLGAEGSVSLITFMILFPILFNGMRNALQEENRSISDTECIYQDTFWNQIRYRILPQLYLEMFQTGKTAASMGLKVGVMAEILGQVKYGIGRKLYYAKIDLNTKDLFAWTFMVIVLSILLEQFFNQLIDRRKKEELGWKDSMGNH